MIPLSVLDTTPVPSGATPAAALQGTIELARHVEDLGFARYWVAEHHNAGALASAAPEVLVAALAARTARIRVGSGGVMLPNHSPLKVAEVFRLLAALHPGRIDLGVGRAAGTDKHTALALRQAPELLGTDAFPEQLDALLRFLAFEPDPAVAFGPLKAVPLGVPSPPVFVLGASVGSARRAGELGLGYAFAHAFAPDEDLHAEALRAYRAAFVPRAEGGTSTTPWAILSVTALAAADDEEAAAAARAQDVQALRFGQGLRDLPFPSPAEAAAYRFDDAEEALRATFAAGRIFGTAADVARRLRVMAAAGGADELMIATNLHDPAERRRSYARLAAALA